MRRLLLLMILAGSVGVGSPAIAGTFTGSLQSDYYLYQDAGKNDRYIFTQSVAGDILDLPFLSKGWKLSFNGELRDSNNPVKGIDDAQLTTLAFSRKFGGKFDVRLGRFLARAGGFSAVDGAEFVVPTKAVKVTVAGGAEHYSLYRTDASNLPDRTRAAVLVEGIIPKGPNWKIDHVTRFKSGEVDDQLTTLGLRCRRFQHFGWDARIGYDSKQSNIRNWMYGLLYKPMKNLQFSLRYTERSYRIYQDSFFAQYEVAPTKLAGLTARYHLTGPDMWLGLGVNHRFREDGDLDRIFVSLANDMGEVGVRMQAGTDMNQLGGWLSIGGVVIRKLSWQADVNFDRWDSSWDSEPTEEWANSLAMTYNLNSIADVQGRVEQFRTGELDSDIRALLTFKQRYAL